MLNPNGKFFIAKIHKIVKFRHDLLGRWNAQ